MLKFKVNQLTMIKKHDILIIIILAMSLPGCSQNQVPDKENQIAAAVMAAPEEERNTSTVFGYDQNGTLTLLREGTNNLICMSDDPNREGFQVVCYHKDLEPFMARGRELRAEGKSSAEIFEMREQEAKDGTLEMPKDGATLHLLEGHNGRYDAATGQVLDAIYRYVVYIPWATSESTGLPLKPLVPGGPWIMDPGTHRAHIMISPPPPEN
jgi:hypothetical protein